VDDTCEHCVSLVNDSPHLPAKPFGTSRFEQVSPVPPGKSPPELLLDKKVNTGSVVAVTGILCLLLPKLQVTFEKVWAAATELDGWEKDNLLINFNNTGQMSGQLLLSK